MSVKANKLIGTVEVSGKTVSSNRIDWSSQLRDSVTEVDELLGILQIHPSLVDIDINSEFGLRVPRPFIELMVAGDPLDPLLRQVLPLLEERRAQSGFTVDPLMEDQFTIATGIIKKYEGRLLLIAAGACAIHCRYCFRRNFPYDANRLSIDQHSLEAIREDESISEVIVSGGDPMMLTDKHFARLLNYLEAIEHVKRFRIHTRFPVVIPSRLTSEFIDRLAGSRLHTTMVLHVNHPNEVGQDLTKGVKNMIGKGLIVLNQSVLLKGVNDDVKVLKRLSERLFEVGILPYYLHMMDPVMGTQHMVVENEKALRIYSRLRTSMPGYLVPRLVRENPGEAAKQWLS